MIIIKEIFLFVNNFDFNLNYLNNGKICIHIKYKNKYKYKYKKVYIYKNIYI